MDFEWSAGTSQPRNEESHLSAPLRGAAGERIAPGIPQTVSVESGQLGLSRQTSVACFLVLRRRDVPDGSEEPQR